MLRHVHQWDRRSCLVPKAPDPRNPLSQRETSFLVTRSAPRRQEVPEKKHTGHWKTGILEVEWNQILSIFMLFSLLKMYETHRHRMPSPCSSLHRIAHCRLHVVNGCPAGVRSVNPGPGRIRAGRGYDNPCLP